MSRPRLQPEYEAAQLRVFATMFEKGCIYRGLKPVWYSPSSQTALAEAELEYPDGHTSPSVYAGFRVTKASEALGALVGDQGAKLAVWTTTPWTLPANLAVAVNENLDYAVVEGDAVGTLVVAEALVEALSAKFGCALEVKGTLKGAALAGTTYTRPVANAGLAGDASVVVGGDYITSDGGTGLVHACVEMNHWFGASPPNFRNLELGHIEVDSAESWTTVPLWSRSRSSDTFHLHSHSELHVSCIF